MKWIKVRYTEIKGQIEFCASLFFNDISGYKGLSFLTEKYGIANRINDLI